MSELSDEAAMRRRSERCLELAGMLKEQKTGNQRILKKILAKFCLQEGVSKYKVQMYLTDLTNAGIIVQSPGKRRWHYDAGAEWDQFTVTI